MAFWNKKKETIVEVRSDGFFTTDSSILTSKAQKIAVVSQNTFQRDLNSSPIIDNAGTTIAMDSADIKVARRAVFGGNQNNIPDAQLYWYGGQGFIGYQLCAMLAQNWLVNKACTTPARDAVRHGFNITVDDDMEVSKTKLDELRKLDKKYKLKKNCIQFIKMSRVFGIRVAMFKVDSTDPNYYTKPFNIDGVLPGTYRGISQIDPYWMAPELDLLAASDPAAINFYTPTYWIINGIRVHASHLVICVPDEVPDVLKPTYMFGGLSIPQKISERVYAAERTANEAPLLAMTKRLTVMRVDITQALAQEGQFKERMEEWTELMNNFGVKVIGEGEEVEQHDTTLNDLDDVIMTQFQLVAAASNIPATKLLGTQPKGFNTTGEFEESSYHEELESMQENDLTPLIERHHALCIKSHQLGEFETSVAWNSLDSLTKKEVAEINKMNAETGSLLINAGAIDSGDERKRVATDPDSNYNGISENELPEDPENPDLDEDANGKEASNQ